MPKPWSEVEQSQQYQSLPQQDKDMAKQEYFKSVVMAKPEFNQLNDTQKQEAQNEFLGDKSKSQERKPNIIKNVAQTFVSAINPMAQKFNPQETIDPIEFYLWNQLFKEIAGISNLSERLGHHVRMVLEVD